MWQNITSVFFLQNKNQDDTLDDDLFCSFLDKIIGFIFAYAIYDLGVNALRTPVYDEMVTIVNGGQVTFSNYKFSEPQLRTAFENYVFRNQRSATRSMITWYAFSFPEQKLLDLSEAFHLEHIYSRKRQELEEGLSDENSLELLGNKVLLESTINIQASDYRFEDKKRIYNGERRRGRNKEASKIAEIEVLTSYNDFQEDEIADRTTLILDTFFDFLRTQDLLK